MVLEEWVAQHRAAILSDWFEHIVGGYPEETARFLRGTNDPFGNPVGAALREELGTVLDGALNRVEDRDLSAALDRIIRVRAVQEMSPSTAIAFVLQLKPIVRQLAMSGGDPLPEEEIDRIEGFVDRLVLMAFDVYTTCREQIFEIRVKSIRDLSAKNIERLNEWRAGQGPGDAPPDDDTSLEEGRRREWAP